MTELLTAIKTRFTSSLAATITGGLHLTAAPQRTAAPYCVYDVVSGPRDQTYSNAGLALVAIDFTVWGKTSSAATLALAESLASTYSTVLSLTGKQNNFARVMGEPLLAPESGEGDEQEEWMWGWIVRMEFGIS